MFYCVELPAVRENVGHWDNLKTCSMKDGGQACIAPGQDHHQSLFKPLSHSIISIGTGTGIGTACMPSVHCVTSDHVCNNLAACIVQCVKTRASNAQRFVRNTSNDADAVLPSPAKHESTEEKLRTTV